MIDYDGGNPIAATPSAGTIDTPEFQSLMGEIIDAINDMETSEPYDSARERLVTYIMDWHSAGVAAEKARINELTIASQNWHAHWLSRGELIAELKAALAAAREQALEEAAKVCITFMREQLDPDRMEAAIEISHEIRALASQPATTAQAPVVQDDSNKERLRYYVRLIRSIVDLGLYGVLARAHISAAIELSHSLADMVGESVDDIVAAGAEWDEIFRKAHPEFYEVPVAAPTQVAAPVLTDAQIVALRGEQARIYQSINGLTDQGAIHFARAILEAAERQPQPAVEYSNAIGQAGERYHSQFQYAHPLPAMWRWDELWSALQAAAHQAGKDGA